MNKRKQTEQFAKLSRALLTSDAWRALGINARRLIDFLLIEHMRHGGKENGRLLAPRRQLEAFGIGEHFVSRAIEEAERLGLVDCYRGVGRRASVYSLTWLKQWDGTSPSNRFLHCHDEAKVIIAALKAAKRRKITEKRAVAAVKQQSQKMTAVCTGNDCQTTVTNPVATVIQQPLRGAVKQQHLSRILSYQGGDSPLSERGNACARSERATPDRGIQDASEADDQILVSPMAHHRFAVRS
jgi:hypothetical protein